MKKLLLLAFTLGLCANSSAQTEKGINYSLPEHARYTGGKRTCGTPVPPKDWDEYFNKQVAFYMANVAHQKNAVVDYTIPVIIHVVHNGESAGTYPNLGNAQLVSQIPILNNDFAGTGLNVGNLAATAFSAVGAANTNIRFCLATQDTDGVALAEPGIHRINRNTMGWANPTSFASTSSYQNYINTVVKPGSIWDPYSFLNVWIVDQNINQVGLLGFATFPAGALMSGLPGNGLGSATTDGVYVWSACWGNVGSLTPGYDNGRTATHEIGHYLGLRHIGGDGNGNIAGDCTAEDYCPDVPPQKGGNAGGQFGQNYGTPVYPIHVNDCGASDPNGDMFMNFMDYCDDAALYMFTPNQRSRMQTAMNNVTGGTFRIGLSTSSATQCAAAPAANITMTNVACANSAITITNNTTGAPNPTYSWTSNPGGVTFSPANTSSNPSITFPAQGNYTVSCTLTNPSGSASYSNAVTVNCVGLADHTLLSNFIKIYPNPSSGKINIAASLPNQQNIDLLIMNSLGQVLLNNTYKNIESAVIPVNMNAMPSGLYFISISNGQEKVVKRVVLNR